MKFTYHKLVLIIFFLSGVIYKISFVNSNKSDLGTYKNPKIALKETVKILDILSSTINNGMKNVQFVDEFEKAKNKIFVNSK